MHYRHSAFFQRFAGFPSLFSCRWCIPVALCGVHLLCAQDPPVPPGATALRYREEEFVKTESNASATFHADGKLGIRLGSDEPGSVTLRPRSGKAWDWSEFQALEVTLSNPSNVRMIPEVTVKSTDGVMPPWQNGNTNSLYLDPGETRKLLVYFTASEEVTGKLYPWLKGTRSGPNTLLSWWKGVDPSAIASITFSALDLSGAQPFEAGEYAVVETRPVRYHELFGYPAKTELPFIDNYGQFKQGNWAGKIADDAGFALRRGAEEADLEANPRPKDWNKWGGWANGPTFPATGYFHVRIVDGKWWFIDPEGKLFWSHGVTDAGRSDSVTIISGRENYFEPMPGLESPLHRFLGKSGTSETYDYYGANLFRKYGEDYKRRTEDHSHRRLASWGMNTFGNWSSGYGQLRTAFTVPVHYTSPNLAPNLPDIWHPDFSAILEKILGDMKTDGVAGSPWNLGFFTHNEINFDKPQNLARLIQGSPADQPAKVAWVRRLETKYGGIESLNRAWKTKYESWDGLLNSTEKIRYKDMKADADECFREYANRFFRIGRDACKQAFPHHLYLGSRLHDQEEPVVMEAAETYCDVISYNLYLKNLTGWTGPKEDLEKPVMSTEFHFGALDRGFFNTGLQPASSQDDRAEHYREYVRSALRHPLIVGTHWFQYPPQCFTGRPDGENYQVGMVDITDTPYPELIRAVREVGGKIYPLRHQDAPPARED